MTDPGRYLDYDPPSKRSPRLYAQMEDVPGSVPTASVRKLKPKAQELDLLRRDLAIYLVIEGGMSFRMAGKVFGLTAPGILKAYRRMQRRKDRL